MIVMGLEPVLVFTFAWYAPSMLAIVMAVCTQEGGVWWHNSVLSSEFYEIKLLQEFLDNRYLNHYILQKKNHLSLGKG